MFSEIRRSFHFVVRSILKLRPIVPFGILSIFILAAFGKLRFLSVFTSRCVNYTLYYEQLSAISMSNDTSNIAKKITTWIDFAQNETNWYSKDICFAINDE